MKRITKYKTTDLTPEILNGPVEMVKDVEKENVDKIDVDMTDLSTLNKDALIRLVESDRQAFKNYEAKLKDKEESHLRELEDISSYHEKKEKDMSTLIAYYERKFKLLSDIITIEGGNK